MAKAQPGSIDFSFQPDFSFQRTNGRLIIALDNDMNLIVGADFIVPLATGSLLQDIVWIGKNGNLDTSIKTKYGNISNTIMSIDVQGNGKVLVSGIFEYFYGKSYPKILRLNKDGTIDEDFHLITLSQREYFKQIKLLPNGKILGIIGSPFNSKGKLIRLNNNGSVDSSFIEYKTDWSLRSIALQSNDKIVIGSSFNPQSEAKAPLVRLNPDGQIDTTFNFMHTLSEITEIIDIEIDKNEKILVGGLFQLQTDTNIVNIMRLNSDGSIDKSFLTRNAFEFNNEFFVRCIYVQKDGRLVLGGRFDSFNGRVNKNIVRLNSDGSLDKEFKTGDGFNGSISSIVSQSEGKIIVGGDFNTFDNFFVGQIVRLNVKNSELNLSISPNPSTGNFKITSSKSINRINITDAVGKEILRTEPMAFDAEIDLSHKSSGVYFVTVFSNGASKCQKILKR